MNYDKKPHKNKNFFINIKNNQIFIIIIIPAACLLITTLTGDISHCSGENTQDVVKHGINLIGEGDRTIYFAMERLNASISEITYASTQVVEGSRLISDALEKTSEDSARLVRLLDQLNHIQEPTKQAEKIKDFLAWFNSENGHLSDSKGQLQILSDLYRHWLDIQYAQLEKPENKPYFLVLAELTVDTCAYIYSWFK